MCHITQNPSRMAKEARKPYLRTGSITQSKRLVKALRDIDKRFQLSEDQHPGSKTVPVAIAEFIGRYVTNTNGIMAGGILAAVPQVLFAMIFQNNYPG
jgi:hypothetical protein